MASSLKRTFTCNALAYEKRQWKSYTCTYNWGRRPSDIGASVWCCTLVNTSLSVSFNYLWSGIYRDFEMQKKEVPMDIRNSKSGNMASSGENGPNIRKKVQVLIWTGPGARRRKRLLLVSSTKYKFHGYWLGLQSFHYDVTFTSLNSNPLSRNGIIHKRNSDMWHWGFKVDVVINM